MIGGMVFHHLSEESHHLNGSAPKSCAARVAFRFQIVRSPRWLGTLVSSPPKRHCTNPPVQRSTSVARGCLECDSKKASSPHVLFHSTAPSEVFDTPEAWYCPAFSKYPVLV